jgi:hypothetical protein
MKSFDRLLDMRYRRLDESPAERIAVAAKAIEIGCGDSSRWLSRRGYLLARTRQWQAAADDFRSALAVGARTDEPSSVPYVAAGQLQLKLGHRQQGIQIFREGFAQFYGELPDDLDQADLSTEFRTHYHNIALSCLVLPEILDQAETDKVHRVLEKLAYHPRSIALARYRLGDFEGALQAVSGFEEENEVLRASFQANIDLIRAMSLAKLGEPDVARRHFESARAALCEFGLESDEPVIPNPWLAWLNSSLLLEEAEREVEHAARDLDADDSTDEPTEGNESPID